MQQRWLPVRPRVVPGEALDSYLVRMALGNGLTPKALSEELSTRAGTPVLNGRAVLVGYTPVSAIVTTIADMGALTISQVVDMTLARYIPHLSPGPGTRLPWIPRFGTAICPECVSTNMIWPLIWRVPHIAVCLTHRLVLHTLCPRCGKPFRTRRTPPLPITLTECDNPLAGTGTCVEPCGQRLDTLERIDASQDQVDAAHLLRAATHEGRDMQLAGVEVSAGDYLANHYAVVLLLSHLAVSVDDNQQPWAKSIRAETLNRTRAKQRLSRSLPLDMTVRAQILSVATEVLSGPTLGAIADRMRPFTSILPPSPAGPRAWLIGHTHRTPFMEDLTSAIVAPDRSFSYQLDHRPTRRLTRVNAIPQAVPTSIYEEHFMDVLPVSPDTGRVFVSLCLARRTLTSATWVSAGTLLGISASVARQTPMNVSARLKVPAAELVNRVIEIEPMILHSRTNYRQREQLVHQVVARRERWFDTWRDQHHIRGDAETAFGNVCEWLWSSYALGNPYSQRWANGWNNDRRYRYRQWTRRLPARVTPSTVLSRKRLSAWGITP